MLGLGVLDSQTEEAEEMARGVAVGLGFWAWTLEIFEQLGHLKNPSIGDSQPKQRTLRQP
jgi:hypothetical protein